MYDIIGDIHGHARELKSLLGKLGYTENRGVYACPNRKVIFVGDYIDRGPAIRETLRIVRNMVESGNAIALMGNHEYNALCYHYEDGKGGFLRRHSEDNTRQHRHTLDEFKNESREYEDYLNWFLTLPLYYEEENFRVVHACWDHDQIAFLRSSLDNDRLSRELVYESAQRGSDFFEAIEDTLKGKEINLPNGLMQPDKEGRLRNELRIRWWEDSTQHTYRSIAFPHNPDLPDEPVDISSLKSTKHYTENDKKVFFGHYWYTGEPAGIRDNIYCLDYSVAKGGKLVAGRLGWEDNVENVYFENCKFE
jgi:hypothetical protein